MMISQHHEAYSRLLHRVEAETKASIRKHLEAMSWEDKRVLGLVPYYPSLPATNEQQEACIRQFAEGLVKKLVGSLEDKRVALATLNQMGVFLVRIVPAWQQQAEIESILSEMPLVDLLYLGVFGTAYTIDEVKAAYNYHIEMTFRAMQKMSMEGN